MSLAILWRPSSPLLALVSTALSGGSNPALMKEHSPICAIITPTTFYKDKVKTNVEAGSCHSIFKMAHTDKGTGLPTIIPQDNFRQIRQLSQCASPRCHTQQTYVLCHIKTLWRPFCIVSRFWYWELHLLSISQKSGISAFRNSVASSSIVCSMLHRVP